MKWFVFVVVLIQCRSSIQAPGLCVNNSRTLLVLPGLGWDLLQNKPKARVIDTHYQFCRLTPDRLFLLPDGVNVQPVRKSQIPLFSELFDDWTTYRSLAARSLNSGPASRSVLGFPTSIEGTFSADYQNAKRREIHNDAMIARTQARHHMYTVYLGHATSLTQDLLDQFEEADAEFARNNTERGRSLLGQIVSEYGTHYTTQVDVGAVLVEENDIRAAAIKNNLELKGKILEAASSNFLKMINFRSTDYSPSLDPTADKLYKDNRINSFVEVIGGSPLRINMTLDSWSSLVPQNPASIGQSGSSLVDAISQSHLPSMSYQSLRRLRTELHRIIRNYYTFNTHVGCTNSTSYNFDYTSNIGDISCNSTRLNFSFGGTYQECTPSTPLAEDVCKKLRVPNQLTGGFTCYSSYIGIPFIDDGTGTRCHRFCNASKCAIECYQLKSVWCSSTQQFSPQFSILFGGVFSMILTNPVTGYKSCPPLYKPVLVGEGLYACLGKASEVSPEYSVPFGGFISQSQSFMKTTICPLGYSQHTGDILDPSGTLGTTAIMYCVNLTSLANDQPATLVLPPFNLFMNSAVPTSSGGGGGPTGWSAGTVVAIVLGVMLLVTVILLIMGCWYVRYKRAKDNRNIQEAPSSERSPILHRESGGNYQTMPGTNEDTTD